MPLPSGVPVPAVESQSRHAVPAIVAIALPVLIAFNVPPSATLLNQLIALGGWGWLVAAYLAHTRGRASRPEGIGTLLAALAAVGLGILASPVLFGHPWGVSLAALGFVGVAALAAVAGASARHDDGGQALFHAVGVALLLAGLVSVGIVVVQESGLSLGQNGWIAPKAVAAQAAGNLRQPNQLSTLLVWSVIALVWLSDRSLPPSSSRWVRVVVPAVALVLLVTCIVLTVSRTGMVCIAVLGIWGWLDASLSRRSRGLLIASPAVYLVAWLVLQHVADAGLHAFEGGSRLHAADLSASRFSVWSQTLSLIAAHPWTGVGWGEFNFAWTLTPAAHRAHAFFDHAHNLPLQLWVELGLPLGTAVLALLALSLFRALQACRTANLADRPQVRAAFVLVLVAAVHAMLEHPLWYAYFLLPVAFALGYCLATAPAASATGHAWRRGVALVAGGVAALSAVTAFDYHRVSSLFDPQSPLPFAQRVEQGRRSIFFGHYADYAAATTARDPALVMAAFDRSTKVFLDEALMIAWARALDASGQTDKARYLAARMKEFPHRPLLDRFFEPCGLPADGDKPSPFQCLPPEAPVTLRSFR